MKVYLCSETPKSDQTNFEVNSNFWVDPECIWISLAVSLCFVFNLIQVTAKGKKKSMGVLDIYGFEIFEVDFHYCAAVFLKLGDSAVWRTVVIYAKLC